MAKGKSWFKVGKGAEDVPPADQWLDNDDIRPLKLEDRTWNLWTYLVFRFSASTAPLTSAQSPSLSNTL